ncbi:MAG: M28 family peptidase [Actinobacteria bacterium]|nr:M28 family peptidase [Actinomycetota bacterium]
MVVINEGQPGRTTPLWFNFDGLEIPTFAATVETGTKLANGVASGDTGQTARFRIDWRPGTYTTRNVIAESTRGDPDNRIVVGAQEQIAAMLNFDIIASPNFVRFVYDGDLSDSDPPPSGAPEGSAQIEELFLDYFASQGLPVEPTECSGRSDYGPFIEVGIPAGGLFTGAEEIKTPAQEEIYGGIAGEQYDQCYHLGCDDIDNLSLTALDQMSDAAAHATISLAQNTEAINGKRGKGNFKVKKRAEPAPLEMAGSGG